LFSSFVVCDSAFSLLPTGVSLTGVFVVFDSAYSPVYSFVLLAGLVMSGQSPVEVTFSVAMSPRGVLGVFGSVYSLSRPLLGGGCRLLL
jgi:hypothetical protein